jgi:hypothetical protein
MIDCDMNLLLWCSKSVWQPKQQLIKEGEVYFLRPTVTSVLMHFYNKSLWHLDFSTKKERE